MRFLHTMIRVKNLDESINFYTKILGMKLLEKSDNKKYKYTLAFLGYDSKERSTVLELTYNYDKHDYDQGDAFGHLAVSSDDIYGFCKTLKEKGIKILREPGPVKGQIKVSGHVSVIAFIEDPNGYKIEIIQE